MKSSKFKVPPKAIIITFPVVFLIDLAASDIIKKNKDEFKIFYNYKHAKGYVEATNLKKDLILKGFKLCIDEIEKVRTDPEQMMYWMHAMGSKPTEDVLWCYITILGKIRYKAKILQFESADKNEVIKKEFSDGRKMSAKNWLYLNEFQKTSEFKKGGFQGFRYVKSGSDLENL